ncbi:Ohr family peroxiredoxin [Rhizobium leguminosarum]|uniref:Ohr family peroxiredoxin n=1 Tax=Rhizobium leguminosarum TaxID=384 RepID=A0A7K3VJD0_RHILE|nr:Ohr family peroxiredoxin [Rhizobium leguminosarum]NEK37353.1 Ohr family peroxiredoxin [Rhizobium leguminosarum]
MSNTQRVIYIAMTDTIGGRESGVARSSDGVLDIRFSAPGSPRIGTNPEQLLSAGWSASFASAIALAAFNRNVAFAGEVSIQSEVEIEIEPGGYTLSVRLRVRLPGIERAMAQVLTAEARRLCPFSSTIGRGLAAVVDLD